MIRRANIHASGALGDFTATWRIVPISALACAIGVLAAYVALALLKLISICTNLFFFQRWDSALISPSVNTLGLLEIIVPVAGAIIVGLMARFGSERIRGHGIPEALEAILIRGSRVEPRVAILKPLSSAIAIGSGGPFGAEGPIIMTGGAFGSMVAQFFHMTSAERKTLLVAGAAAGMSATFASPIAAVLLSVELLLFEFKPRSFVPVALASATAMFMRSYLMEPGPLFAVDLQTAGFSVKMLAGCVAVGVAVGTVSYLMTLSVYSAEELFQKLPFHWMWWPAIGGLFVGIGGLICPGALGVGYDRIGALLHDSLPFTDIVRLVTVKWSIWAVALGSGTSGGVLAPLLMVGSAVGGILSSVLPGEASGFWPLVAMGAILGGTMRAPLTGVIFAVELTHALGMAFPLLIATTVAYGFTVLVMRRSILTEKLARRGFHVSREYAIDPSEILFVREVMDTKILAFPLGARSSDVRAALSETGVDPDRLYPLVDDENRLAAIINGAELSQWTERAHCSGCDEFMRQTDGRIPIIAYPDETLRTVTHRMAVTRHTRLPVIDPVSEELLGIITLEHTLDATEHHLEEEIRRDQPLPPVEFLTSVFGLNSILPRSVPEDDDS